MHLLYLDHSGAPEDATQKHFVLASISVFERQTFWISTELDKIAARFNPSDPASVELHASPMHGGRGEWRRFPVPDRVQAICDALSVVPQSHPSNILFGVGIKKPQVNPEIAVEAAFEQTCITFDKYLWRMHLRGDTQRGMIVFDKAAYETDIQALATGFRSIGHSWGVVRNLSEVPVFLDSKASRLLQLADLVSFALYRVYERNDYRFFNIVKNRFDVIASEPRSLSFFDLTEKSKTSYRSHFSPHLVGGLATDSPEDE
jgi:hypothetical protein